MRPEQWDELLVRYKKGELLKILAKDYAVHEKTIYRRVRRLGLPKRRIASMAKGDTYVFHRLKFGDNVRVQYKGQLYSGRVVGGGVNVAEVAIEMGNGAPEEIAKINLADVKTVYQWEQPSPALMEPRATAEEGLD